ncbi:hypothetical protein AN478_04535 [Thiohalorhabdus denitrificans]|uniref:Uncharacterized protein n=1 Tax=Thiohalorhabdus denitrificans TaxID=381306 RepID=A0A0P9C7N5_9GAMM|nr:hypothetical protein [Thiohalorhabdus denitrificans]KPV41168.1 hypothetical protein AN478_04535 [Thiohalorhabdus denitrificans]SCY35934.1 hypothetical protein SAMN05661077_1869 [Thiohalorhabdus denitrificans]
MDAPADDALPVRYWIGVDRQAEDGRRVLAEALSPAYTDFGSALVALKEIQVRRPDARVIAETDFSRTPGKE